MGEHPHQASARVTIFNPIALTPAQTAFLESQHSAAMITIGEGGIPKAVRVGVALVDGRLWSSGTQGRVRTRRLQRDPRCTLFVFDQAFSWLTLEATVSILDGPEAATQNVRLFRVMQNRPARVVRVGPPKPRTGTYRSGC